MTRLLSLEELQDKYLPNLRGYCPTPIRTDAERHMLAELPSSRDSLT